MKNDTPFALPVAHGMTQQDYNLLAQLVSLGLNALNEQASAALSKIRPQAEEGTPAGSEPPAPDSPRAEEEAGSTDADPAH